MENKANIIKKIKIIILEKIKKKIINSFKLPPQENNKPIKHNEQNNNKKINKKLNLRIRIS